MSVQRRGVFLSEPCFFSVLIPVYNVELFIAECLNSVSCQSFTDYEIIIIDDGSTDGSLKICNAFSEKNPGKINVIHQKNQGLLITRRNAIKQAAGKYLVFLDSDDALREDALSVLKKQIDQSNPDIVIFRASIDRNFNCEFSKQLFPDSTEFSGEEISKLRNIICSSDKLNNMCLKAVKNSIVDRATDYLKYKHISLGEDLLQSLPLYDTAKRITYCSEMLYFYRQNENGITHEYNTKQYDSIRDVEAVREKYAKKWDSSDAFYRESRIHATYYFYSSVYSILKSRMTRSEKERDLMHISEDPFFLKWFSERWYAKEPLKKRLVVTALRMHLFGLLLFFADNTETCSK